MIGWREAQARLFVLASPVAPESVPTTEAGGRWTSAPVRALRTQPAADLSAMDGYAIRHADLPGPWRVIGQSAAGRPFPGTIGKGEAVRIFTGADLPDSADAVLIQEHASCTADQLSLTGDAPLQRQWVRPRGIDFSAGTDIIASGAYLGPARIALAILAGNGTLPVRRTVRVALASTGDELGSSLPDSNDPMLAQLLADMPVDFVHSHPVPDGHAALKKFFEGNCHHDVIVTTGGASVGQHDLIAPVLRGLGAEPAFRMVAMRPGKPVMAWRLGDAVVLALPGNPVSAFVTAHVFLRPLIAHLSGAAEPGPATIKALLGAPLPAVGARTDFVRMRWANGTLVPAPEGDSGALRPLAEAGALAIRAAHAQPAQAGETIEAMLIA